jgi:DNA processing protein
MNATEACIALNMLPTIGPVRLRKLLRVFETPEQVLAARGAALRAVEGIGPEVAEQIVGWESVVDLPAELARIRDFGAHVITAESPTYPRQLREIHAPPIVLYVWGELSERDQHAIGIIGSRRTTHYGTESAKKLSYQLAYAGLTVISGLARGIDTAAHQGALAAKGRTIAVIGSGFIEALPAGERGARGEDRQRERRCRVRVLDGCRAGPPDVPDAQPDHQRLEPRHPCRGSRPE